MLVATVLTACGIETDLEISILWIIAVATVLTACGIETIVQIIFGQLFYFRLQQYLPLAVLKLYVNLPCCTVKTELQQYLPLAVLKLSWIEFNIIFHI